MTFNNYLMMSFNVAISSAAYHCIGFPPLKCDSNQQIAILHPIHHDNAIDHLAERIARDRAKTSFVWVTAYNLECVLLLYCS